MIQDNVEVLNVRTEVNASPDESVNPFGQASDRETGLETLPADISTLILTNGSAIIQRLLQDRDGLTMIAG